ncbi:hypothetical protein V2A60_005325 [Cordyceps javanica]|uniref:FAR1 DNA-bindingdomain-containing protein n=1 Tax=Cordyceps javanica TaxID=43265 RepID=A0A545VDW3_9HYPO|nr:FAR1 DNA-bindingdomain-containing protein [Cordyceps javanica]TQW10425.1 FAR1 DNA-binding domain-containing protein [Cordyceps javanica]
MASLHSLEDRAFPSVKAALDTLQSQQNLLGFAISLSGSYRTRNGQQSQTYFRCDRGGARRKQNSNPKHYKTTTKKCNCGFKGVIRLSKFLGTFSISFLHDQHNHEPLRNPANSARIRRHTQQQFGIERLRELIITKSADGQSSSGVIASQLTREFPGLEIIAQDVRTIQSHLRREQYGAEQYGAGPPTQAVRPGSSVSQRGGSSASSGASEHRADAGAGTFTARERRQLAAMQELIRSQLAAFEARLVQRLASLIGPQTTHITATPVNFGVIWPPPSASMSQVTPAYGFSQSSLGGLQASQQPAQQPAQQTGQQTGQPTAQQTAQQPDIVKPASREFEFRHWQAQNQ